MSSERDLADLIDVERYLEEPTDATWSGDTRLIPPPSPPATEDAEEIQSLIEQRFHSYRASAHLGSGSCAHVFRGEHVQLSRSVAIKVLKPRFLGSRVVVERMGREAEALLELRHPNIVECFEFGALPNGLPFLILELIPGRTLLDRIIRGPLLPAESAAAFAGQIAQGLAALHQRGLIHRDLKASNVMVAGSQVKITDLGIVLLEGSDATRLTVAAHVLGTRAYMAPEQLRDPRSVTSAADLYALGVVLFAMITGRLPEAGLRAPPGPLAPLLQRLLDPDPAKRPSAAEVVRLLEPAKFRRWPVVVALAAASVAAVLLALQTPSSPDVAVVLPPPPPPIETPRAIEIDRPELDPPRADPKPKRARRRKPVKAEVRAEAPVKAAATVKADAKAETLPPARDPSLEPIKRVDPAELDRRLTRTFEQLRAAAGSLSPAELDPLEATYLSVRRSLAASQTNLELERVARDVHDLEREVRRVLDRGTLDR